MIAILEYAYGSEFDGGQSYLFVILETDEDLSILIDRADEFSKKSTYNSLELVGTTESISWLDFSHEISMQDFLKEFT